MTEVRENNKLNKKIVAGVLSLAAAIIGGVLGGGAYTQNKVNTEIQVIADSDGSAVKITKELTERAVVAEEALDSLKKELGQLEEDYTDLSDKNELLIEENKQLKEQTVLAGNVEEDTEQSTKKSAEAIKLSELTVVSSEDYEKIDGFADSYGNQYDVGYQFRAADEGFATYSLQGKYASFEAVIVAAEKTGTTSVMTVFVYKDDEVIDTITGITKETETRKIGPYELTGARSLMIKTALAEGDYPGFCFLTNAYIKE